MNKKYISILFILIFYACEFKILEDLDPPNWYWDLSVPLIDNEYSFEGILQEGVLTTTAEEFTDSNGNGVWDNGNCNNSNYTNECDCDYAGEICNPGETFRDENNYCI